MGPQPLQVLLEQLVLGPVRGPVEVAAGRAGFVGAEEEAAVLLPHVPGGIGLAQHAHLRQSTALALQDRGMRLGDDVLVLDRDHGNVEPEHLPGSPGEVAGGADHVLAGDVAAIGLDQPLAAGRALDAEDGRVAVDLAPARPAPLGQRLGEVRRLDVAVVRVLDGTQEVLRLAERPDLLHLRGREHVHPDAQRVGDALVGHELVPAVPRPGEADVRDRLEADGLARLLFQRPVKRHRGPVELADGVAHVEQRQEAGGMPGRAGGELLPLEEDDVAPAELRELVERGDPDHAAADHDHARMRPHGSSPDPATKLADFRHRRAATRPSLA
jgi:hypothetical protein